MSGFKMFHPRGRLKLTMNYLVWDQTRVTTALHWANRISMSNTVHLYDNTGVRCIMYCHTYFRYTHELTRTIFVFI